jgi:O-antigen/teichoic acid export membrane protein
MAMNGLGAMTQVRDRARRRRAGWRRSLIANAGSLWLAELGCSASGLLFWGGAARLVAPEGIGLVAGVLSAAALTSAVAGLGTGIGLIRLLPEARDRAQLLDTAVAWNLTLGLATAGLYLLGVSHWSPTLLALQHDPCWTIAFFLYGAAAPVASLARSAFLALRQADRQLSVAMFGAGGRLLLLPLALLGEAGGLLAAATLPTVGSVLLSLAFLLPRSMPGYRPRVRLAVDDLRLLLPYSAAIYLADLPLQAVGRALPLLILGRLGPAAGGYFQIAWLIGGALTAPGLALMGAALAEGAHDMENGGAILGAAARMGLLVTLPAGVVVVAGGRWLLALAGPGYSEHGLGVLWWLAGGAPMVVLAWYVLTWLRLRRQLGRLVALSALPAMITLIIVIPLLSRAGLQATGMAWVAGHTAVVAGAACAAAWNRWRRSR